MDDWCDFADQQPIGANMGGPMSTDIRGSVQPCPTATLGDVVDRPHRHTKPLRQCSRGLASCCHRLPDRPHQIRREDRPGYSASTGLASLRNHVRNVLRTCAKEQVVGSPTRRVVAGVTHIQRPWVDAVDRLKDEAVDVEGAVIPQAANCGAAVTLPIVVASPFPTSTPRAASLAWRWAQVRLHAPLSCAVDPLTVQGAHGVARGRCWTGATIETTRTLRHLGPPHRFGQGRDRLRDARPTHSTGEVRR